MANPTWRAGPVSAVSAGSAVSSSVTVPAGWSAGDVAYLAVSQTGGQAITVSSTNGAAVWTTAPALQGWNGTTSRLTVYECVLTAADIGSTVTVTFAATQLHAIALVALGGAAGRACLAEAVVSSTAGTSAPFNGVNPGVADCATVYFLGTSLATSGATGQTHSQPTNYTEAIDVVNTGTNNHAALAIGYRMLTGGAGTKETPPNSTISLSARYCTLVLAIAPTGGTGIVERLPTVAESSSATTVTGTLPVDLKTGDYVVAVMGTSDTIANFTGPGGSWTQLVAPMDGGLSGRTLAVYGMFNPGAGPQVSQVTAGRITCLVQAFGSVDTTTPIDVSAATSTGSTSPLAVAAVTIANANAREISGAIVDAATGSWTPPTTAGLTITHTGAPSGVGRGLAMGTETRTSTGTTGTRTWTWSATSLAMGGFNLALRLATAPSPQTVSPTGIGSGEAFGSPTVTQAVLPTGIASAEALGSPTVTLKALPTGIASAEALGSPTVTLTVAPAGIASAGAFGTPTVSLGSTGTTLSPTGIASAEAFGAPTVSLRAQPTGIASAEAFGSPTVVIATTLFPLGIGSAEALGEPTVTVALPALLLAPVGIETAEAFGLPVVTLRDYIFTGPTSTDLHRFRLDLEAEHPDLANQYLINQPPLLLDHVVGLTVYRDPGGAWHTTAAPTWEQQQTATRFYAGGRLHTVDQLAAAELIEAGYGAYLTPK